MVPETHSFISNSFSQLPPRCVSIYPSCFHHWSPTAQMDPSNRGTQIQLAGLAVDHVFQIWGEGRHLEAAQNIKKCGKSKGPCERSLNQNIASRHLSFYQLVKLRSAYSACCLTFWLHKKRPFTKKTDWAKTVALIAFFGDRQCPGQFEGSFAMDSRHRCFEKPNPRESGKKPQKNLWILYESSFSPQVSRIF